MRIERTQTRLQGVGPPLGDTGMGSSVLMPHTLTAFLKSGSGDWIRTNVFLVNSETHYRYATPEYWRWLVAISATHGRPPRVALAVTPFKIVREQGACAL